MKRRRLWQVGAWYGSFALATALATSELWEPIGLPASAPRLTIIGLAAGLPLVLLAAWLSEGRLATVAAPTPAGDPPVAEARSDSRRSIVVLPFDNLSPDVEDAYLADGLAEEITTDLSAIRSLRVTSSTSAKRLKGSKSTPAEAGRMLGVDFVLEGSIRKAGGGLRINVRLVDTASEESAWSERYSGQMADIFEIQEQVARSVSAQLALRLSDEEARALASRPFEDPRALESYIRARHETWSFSRAGLKNAERHLKNALAFVGDNALLYSALGHAYTWYAQLGLDPHGKYLMLADKCAERVFSLEPESPRGYWLRAMVRFQGGELRETRAPLERAIEQLPDDSDALIMMGYLSALQGQHSRAREAFAHLLKVDPLTPISHAMPGFVSFLEGRPEDAVAGYERYFEMEPESPFSAWCLAWILLLADRVPEAASVVEGLEQRHPDSIYSGLGSALVAAVGGDRTAALAAVTDEMLHAAKRTELLSRELTHCFALAGETAQALDWLENTIRIGNVNYPYWSRHDPWVASIRSEQRFIELMTQLRREWLALNPDQGDPSERSVTE